MIESKETMLIAFRIFPLFCSSWYILYTGEGSNEEQLLVGTEHALYYRHVKCVGIDISRLRAKVSMVTEVRKCDLRKRLHGTQALTLFREFRANPVLVILKVLDFE